MKTPSRDSTPQTSKWRTARCESWRSQLSISKTDAEHSSEAALENGYTFLGLVGMIDPPRPGVADAIRRATDGRHSHRDAHRRSVKYRHRDRSRARPGRGGTRALHARDLLDVEQSRLAYLARKTDVFARVSPEEKLRIVEALQQSR